jgi:hypothetical protein
MQEICYLLLIKRQKRQGIKGILFKPYSFFTYPLYLTQLAPP